MCTFFFIDQEKRFIFTGINQTYTGIPFEPILQPFAITEHIAITLTIHIVYENPIRRTQYMTK